MTSSVQGNVFFLPNKVAYSASKAAITAMGKSLSKELKPHDISVNVITPGGVETSMAERLREMGQQMPMTVPPEAISPIYVFLVTKEAKNNRYGGKVIDQMKLFEFLPDIQDFIEKKDFDIKYVYEEMKSNLKKQHAKIFRNNQELIDFLLRFKRG
jgi:NAD(P)-dependent dehydrogenase (short-subunit alcohol dehydrogenase family)